MARHRRRPFVDPFVKRVGIVRAAWISSAAVVAGLAVYTALGGFGYVWVALALALVAAGLRVNGVVAAVNVIGGLPADRTTIGAALTDTSSEVASALGVAVAGTVLATLFAGDIVSAHWTIEQTDQFRAAVTIAGALLTTASALLVAFGIARGRR